MSSLTEAEAEAIVWQREAADAYALARDLRDMGWTFSGECALVAQARAARQALWARALLGSDEDAFVDAAGWLRWKVRVNANGTIRLCLSASTPFAPMLDVDPRIALALLQEDAGRAAPSGPDELAADTLACEITYQVQHDPAAWWKVFVPTRPVVDAQGRVLAVPVAPVGAAFPPHAFTDAT